MTIFADIILYVALQYLLI